MKIIVDADACPVKDVVKKVAKMYGLVVLMVCDTSHQIQDEYCDVITVDKFADSADIRIINLAEENDLVITQDYGVAAMALGKRAFAMNNFGDEYTNENMDKLLFERFLGKKVRRAGGRTKGPKKRTKANDVAFEEKITDFLKNNAWHMSKTVILY